MATTSDTAYGTDWPELPSHVNAALMHRLHERLSLWRYLDLEAPWIKVDLQERAPNGESVQDVIINLREHELIEIVGERSQADDERLCRRVNEWRWKPQVVEELESYHEAETRFENLFGAVGCGHKVHISNTPGSGLGCQYCECERNYPAGPIAEALGVER